MAEYTALAPLFTDIADAIRSKTGETGKITANSFPEKITALSSLQVGTIIRMNYGNVLTDFIIVQIGLPSDAYDESCDGVWIMPRYIPADSISDYHNNYYPNTVFHSYMNSTYLNKFDAGVRNIIKSVKIPCTYYDNDQGKEISLKLQCKVFAPSMEELGFPDNYMTNYCKSGAVLQYFTNFNAGMLSINAYQTGISTTGSVGYTFRTCSNTDGEDIACVKGSTIYNVSTLSIRPIFILPKTITIDENNNLIV